MGCDGDIIRETKARSEVDEMTTITDIGLRKIDAQIYERLGFGMREGLPPCETCGQPAHFANRDVREMPIGDGWREYETADDQHWHCAKHPREAKVICLRSDVDIEDN